MKKNKPQQDFRENNLKTPKYFLLHKNYEGNIIKKIKKKRIKFPVVIKPVNEGSSLGVYICKNKIKFKNELKISLNQFFLFFEFSMSLK